MNPSSFHSLENVFLSLAFSKDENRTFDGQFFSFSTLCIFFHCLLLFIISHTESAPVSFLESDLPPLCHEVLRSHFCNGGGGVISFPLKWMLYEISYLSCVFSSLTVMCIGWIPSYSPYLQFAGLLNLYLDVFRQCCNIFAIMSRIITSATFFLGLQSRVT